MKSILYVGATLMIGASIYGFVDYQKTSRTKEFTKMYDPKETTTAPIPVPGKNEIEVKKESPAKESITQETKTATPVSLNESVARIKDRTGNQKRFSYKLFSRAALDEKYINKELKIKDITESTQKDSARENNKQ